MKHVTSAGKVNCLAGLTSYILTVCGLVFRDIIPGPEAVKMLVKSR
jgi:hypothetical protein